MRASTGACFSGVRSSPPSRPSRTRLDVCCDAARPVSVAATTTTPKIRVLMPAQRDPVRSARRGDDDPLCAGVKAARRRSLDAPGRTYDVKPGRDVTARYRIRSVRAPIQRFDVETPSIDDTQDAVRRFERSGLEAHRLATRVPIDLVVQPTKRLFREYAARHSERSTGSPTQSRRTGVSHCAGEPQRASWS